MRRRRRRRPARAEARGGFEEEDEAWALGVAVAAREVFCARVSRSQREEKRIEREETPNANRFCQLPKNTDRHLIQRSVFGFYRNLQTLFARRDVLLFFLTLPWRAFLFDRSDADDRGAASEASATLGDRGVRPASRGGCGRGAERVRPRPGLRPVWSAFGGARGARGATRRSSRTDSARSIRGDPPPIAAHVELRRGRVRRCASRWLRRAFRRLLCPVRPMATTSRATSRKRSSPPRRRVRRPARVADHVRSRGDGHPARARGRGDDVHVGRAPRA